MQWAGLRGAGASWRLPMTDVRAGARPGLLVVACLALTSACSGAPSTPAASAPAAPGVTRQQLAAEGASAAVAAAPVAPPDPDAEAKGLRASMTAGADKFRGEHRGGSAVGRFNAPTHQGR